MNSYAVFLRGINAGGINIKMAALRKALASGPFSGVQTVLASGNAVLSSVLGPAAVKAEAEACLRETFGYDASVVVLPSARVADLVAACPYPPDDATAHTYLTLASDPYILVELQEAGRALDCMGLTLLGPEALAGLAPVGGTLDSPFSKLIARP